MTTYATGGPVRGPGLVLLGDDYIVPIKLSGKRCPHAQAEPVTLSTGERVACVCIACLDGLPEDWVQKQYEQAQRQAYCAHEDELDITGFGQVEHTLTCVSCGRMRTE